MNAALPGYVYYDANFTFHDGKKGPKLFIILCDSPLDDANVVVARTTSKQKNIEQYGCYLDTYPPCFFVPKESSCFTEKTWVMLDYVVEYEKKGLERMTRTTQLSITQTKDILLCGSECIYIERYITEALRVEANKLI